MTVDGVANSRIFCRHPPHGVASISPSAMVRITSIARSPAAAIAAIAPASAHVPSGYGGVLDIASDEDASGRSTQRGTDRKMRIRRVRVDLHSRGPLTADPVPSRSSLRSYVWRQASVTVRVDTTGAFGHGRDGRRRNLHRRSRSSSRGHDRASHRCCGRSATRHARRDVRTADVQHRRRRSRRRRTPLRTPAA